MSKAGMTRQLGFLLAVVALLAAGWLHLRSDEPPGAVLDASSDGRTDSPPDSGTDGPPATGAVEERAVMERSPVERSDATVTVRFTLNSAPIGDVEVFALDYTEDVAAVANTPPGIPPRLRSNAKQLRSDEHGVVEIPCGDCYVLIAARGPGTAPTGAYVEPGSNELTVELAPSFQATGTVYLHGGGPAAGASVIGQRSFHFEQTFLGPSYSHPSRLAGMFFTSTTTVGADGRFVLDGLHAGSVGVSIHYPGYASFHRYDLYLPDLPEAHAVLRPGSVAVGGSVVDETTGAPIEGALVDCFEQTQGGTFAQFDRLLTDLEGRFATRIVSLGDMIQASGEPTILMRPADRIEGVVVGPDGSPVPWARVRVYAEPGGEMLGMVSNGRNGSYACDFVTAGETYSMHFERDGFYSDRWLRGVTTESLEPRRVELEPNGELAGRVLAGGEPVGERGHVHLTMTTEAGGPLVDRSTEIDSDGTFRFANVGRGRYRLVALAYGYAPHAIDPLDFDFDQATPIDVEVTKGTVLHGHVFDPRGAPIEGAAVSLGDVHDEGIIVTRAMPREVTTAVDGSYELGHVEAGLIGLIVTHPDHSHVTALVQVPPGHSTWRHDMTLPAPGAIAISVIGENGQPLRRFSYGLSGTASTLISKTDTDDGAARVDNVPPGTVSVHAQPPMDSPSAAAGQHLHARIDVVAGATTDVVFDLTHGGRVDGTVRWPDWKNTWRRIGVRAVPLKGGRSSFVGTDHRGRYRLLGLDPGPVRLEAESIDHGPRLYQSIEVDVVDGEELIVDFEFGPGTIQGVVVDAKDHPARGVDVVVLTQSDDPSDPSRRRPRAFTTTGDDGSFELVGLHAGSYTYYLDKPGFGRTEGTTTLVEGAASEPLRLIVVPEATIAVTVVDAVGQLVDGASVVATSASAASPHVRRLTRDAGGTHRLDRLTTDAYRLRIEADHHFTEFLDVDCVSGSETSSSILMRRVADLSVRLRDAAGAPARENAFALVDRGSGTAVAKWIADGRVDSDPAGLVTDDHGRCRVTGLPVGVYDISALGQVRSVEVSTEEAARVSLQALP